MRTPGAREDWVEFILRGEQVSDHIGLEVPDISAASGPLRIAAGHWVIDVADTNGIRAELMEPNRDRKGVGMPPVSTTLR